MKNKKHQPWAHRNRYHSPRVQQISLLHELLVCNRIQASVPSLLPEVSTTYPSLLKGDKNVLTGFKRKFTMEKFTLNQPSTNSLLDLPTFNRLINSVFVRRLIRLENINLQQEYSHLHSILHETVCPYICFKKPKLNRILVYNNALK